jgi:AcrR family transcriptional regulator
MTPAERVYRSELRARQATETRAAILDAARASFLASGYATATMAEIARQAGVSAQTVYAHFGSKAGVMQALVDYMNERAGVDELAIDVVTAPTPAATLRASVHLVCVLHERIGDFILILLDASRVDASLAPAVDAGRASHRGPQLLIANRLASAGVLREDVSEATAADLLTEWTSPEAVERYVSLEHWSYEQIVERLPSAVARALCRPGAEDAPWPEP